MYTWKLFFKLSYFNPSSFIIIEIIFISDF